MTLKDVTALTIEFVDKIPISDEHKALVKEWIQHIRAPEFTCNLENGQDRLTAKYNFMSIIWQMRYDVETKGEDCIRWDMMEEQVNRAKAA